MSTTVVLDISTARSILSELVDKVYLKGEDVVITKRNIPLVRIAPLKEKEEERVIDLSLFGLWKDKSEDSLTLEKKLRTKTWKRSS